MGYGANHILKIARHDGSHAAYATGSAFEVHITAPIPNKITAATLQYSNAAYERLMSAAILLQCTFIFHITSQRPYKKNENSSLLEKEFYTLRTFPVVCKHFKGTT